MKKKELKLEFIECKRNEITNLEDLNLIEKCYEVFENAYAPYSNFKVGAAILLENGEIITGTNQENAAYPSGLCAERVAMFYANSKFPNVKVKTIAVAAKYNGKIITEPIPPCGACRQVILETENRFKQNIKIILAGYENVLISENIKQLLPLNFDESFFK